MSEEMEPILEPDLKIVDAHHHLMDGPGHRYTIDAPSGANYLI